MGNQAAAIDQVTDFRMRGHDVLRLEALSDVVFGFALTLLVVSLHVPRTFDDLMVAMRGFPAFLISAHSRVAHSLLLLSPLWSARREHDGSECDSSVLPAGEGRALSTASKSGLGADVVVFRRSLPAEEGHSESGARWAQAAVSG